MIRLYYIILTLLGVLTLQTNLAQGLKFSGAEQAIDKRTSYKVFDKKSPEFSESFEIAFDLRLYPMTEIGYIIRIKNANSNKIYNLFYDGQGNNITFRFNEEGKSSLISVQIDSKELLNAPWFQMKIAFNLKNDSINLTIHDKTYSKAHAGLPEKYRPILVFGKSDHLIDVPSFAIRNLTVGNNKKHLFALRENSGGVVHNSKGRPTGSVINPEWLINDAYHWRFATSLSSKSVAGSSYNSEKKEVYYFNRDAIHIYNVRSGELQTHPFGTQCPVHLTLGMNFIDAAHDKLYAYEVYRNDPPFEGPTVASLDLKNYRWTAESHDALPLQRHHHGAYFDPEQGQYTIFGGFGNMRYSKDFQTFDLQTKAWQEQAGFAGDTIYPRYFSSVGYLKKNNSIYVFGGMGNESGEQVVGRNYLYDLHRVDLTTKRISKLWEIPWEGSNAVPVRGMVILDDSSFYTLCYPESHSNSVLRLYRFSLADGSYEILGDSIPIHSDKITTNANLYYDDQLNNLYVTVQEFDNDIVSNLKIYSLAFPPITAVDLVNSAKKQGNGTTWIILILACLCAAAFGYSAFRKFRDKSGVNYDLTDNHNSPTNKGGGSSTRPNSVYLFGDFMVRDRHNKDITYMFSARLKQTLCLILQYSAEDGITSQRLSNLLWPDKAEDKVKNSRGVTINHLRKTLSELDGVELIFDKGYFRIVQYPPFYCDYTRCLELISANNAEEGHEELIQILTLGKFLKFSNQPLFDTFKEETEHKLVPVLLLEIERSFAAEAYQTTLDLTTALFDVDPLNDDALAFQTKALQRLKMSEEARIRYQAFMLEYKKTMGKEYPHPFKIV